MTETFSDEDVREFRSRFDATGDECWTWDRAEPHRHRKNERGGYGTWRGRPAHVVAWLMAYGAIPDDPRRAQSKSKRLEVCHLCDTRNCVRVDHLFLANHRGNHRDAANKSRKWSPPGARERRLTAEIVLAMRRRVLHGETREALCREFGVAVSTVMKAVAGTGPYGTWRHLPGALGWTDGPHRKQAQGFLFAF